jgi:dienelactone hydrolase
VDWLEKYHERMKRNIWIALVALLTSSVLTAVPVSAAPGTLVRFESRDGFELAGNYFDPGKPGPGVLLLHQCNADKAMWDAIGAGLADAGIHVLAMDYRGYGDSTADGATTIETPNAQRRQRLHVLADGDVLIGYRKLISTKGVDSTRIGTGGASCGGPRSIRVARIIENLRTMVFLSTYVDDELITDVGRAAKVPLLAIAAEDDGLTPASLRRLFEISEAPGSRLLLYKGDEHGQPLFKRDPRLETLIIDWYRDHL